MKRVLLTTVASLCLAIVPAVANATSASAAVPRKGAVCPTFTSAGEKIQWSVVGSGLTCSAAKKWVLNLVGEQHDKSELRVTFTHVPTHYHCQGSADDTGHATVGSCWRGSQIHPKSGFQWFGS